MSAGRVARFAPSPNGFLHLGHAYSAMLNARLAAPGAMLLRQENIDRARCNQAFETAICEDLAWLGLAWRTPVLRQSERSAAYAAALDGLERRDLIYPCFCTRGDIVRAIGDRPDWPRDPDGSPLYPGTCRNLAGRERQARAAAAPAGRRLDMTRALASIDAPLGWNEHREGDAPLATAADPAVWGDALLARKDVPTSYHLAVVVDDAAQGVTDVVRGADLFAATSLHRVIQAVLGLSAPAYHHHRLILDASGHKLAKSRAAPSLRALRAGGATPTTIRRMLGLA